MVQVLEIEYSSSLSTHDVRPFLQTIMHFMVWLYRYVDIECEYVDLRKKKTS
jgi:hypothetical protein